MNRDDNLREIQRRITEAKGYTQITEGVVAVGVEWPAASNWLSGTLHADEGPTLIPRWPWDWCAAGDLVAEMRADSDYNGLDVGEIQRQTGFRCALWLAQDDGRDCEFSGKSSEPAEAIARCWCAWKGIDLSDMSPNTEVEPR